MKAVRPPGRSRSYSRCIINILQLIILNRCLSNYDCLYFRKCTEYYLFDVNTADLPLPIVDGVIEAEKVLPEPVQHHSNTNVLMVIIWHFYLDILY